MGKKSIETAILVAVGFAVGIAADFVVNGVFKIIWIAIYLPVYTVMGVALFNGFAKTRWAPQSSRAIIGFCVGALASHLFFTGHQKIRSYTMTLAPGLPITLISPAWTQRLIVASDPLSAKLVGHAAGESVEVTIDYVTHYGCISSYRVLTIAGVDVAGDPQATWTWKSPNPGPNQTGPSTNYDPYFWCKINFYR